MPAETPELPKDLLTALEELVWAFERKKIRYALIGAVAAGFRSRPRFTQDLDFLLEIPQLVLPALLDDLRDRGFHFDLATTIREWTQQHLTALSFRSVRIDWLKPVLACYQHVINEGRPESWLGTSVRIASPEGLILTKLLAFRTQDQLDIENLLAANRGQLDLDWIRNEWQQMMQPDDPRMQRFAEMVERLYVVPRSGIE